MMSELPLPRRQIMTERMRMAQVRKAFGQALEQSGDQPANLKAFYGACSRYLQAALDRLHAQDQRIIDKLSPLIAPDDADSQELLAGFDNSLRSSRGALKELMDALDAYEGSDVASQQTFEQAARRFMDVFLNILAARRHSSQHLEEEHFDDADWVEVAGVTDQSLATERALFQAACDTAPAGLSPEAFSVGPPPA